MDSCPVGPIEARDKSVNHWGGRSLRSNGESADKAPDLPGKFVNYDWVYQGPVPLMRGSDAFASLAVYLPYAFCNPLFSHIADDREDSGHGGETSTGTAYTVMHL